MKKKRFDFILLHVLDLLCLQIYPLILKKKLLSPSFYYQNLPKPVLTPEPAIDTSKKLWFGFILEDFN